MNMIIKPIVIFQPSHNYTADDVTSTATATQVHLHISTGKKEKGVSYKLSGNV